MSYIQFVITTIFFIAVMIVLCLLFINRTDNVACYEMAMGEFDCVVAPRTVVE